MIWVFGFAIGLTGLFWVVSQRMRRIELKEFRRLLNRDCKPTYSI